MKGNGEGGECIWGRWGDDWEDRREGKLQLGYNMYEKNKLLKKTIYIYTHIHTHVCIHIYTHIII